MIKPRYLDNPYKIVFLFISGVVVGGDPYVGVLSKLNQQNHLETIYLRLNMFDTLQASFL